MSTQYNMRAYKTTEPNLGYVSWVVYDAPDTTGSSSGYSPSDLINIVVNNIIQTSSGSSTNLRQSYSPPWGGVYAASEISNVLINEQTSSQSYPDLEFPYVWDVVFPAGWSDTRTIIVNGQDRSGGTISEIFTPIAGGGGGRVHGEKVFMGPITFTISSPGGDGSHDASMQYRNVICVDSAPVERFHYLSMNTIPNDIASFNLLEGWVEPAGHVLTFGDSYIVFYTG